jgi:hypothetical protein
MTRLIPVVTAALLAAGTLAGAAEAYDPREAAADLRAAAGTRAVVVPWRIETRGAAGLDGRRIVETALAEWSDRFLIVPREKALAILGPDATPRALADMGVDVVLVGDIEVGASSLTAELTLVEVATGAVRASYWNAMLRGGLSDEDLVWTAVAGLATRAGGAPSENVRAMDVAPVAVFKTNPPADASGTIRGSAPLVVTFNQCRSTDGDGDVIRYFYDWDGDGEPDSQGHGAGCRRSHTFTQASSRGQCTEHPIVCLTDGTFGDGNTKCARYDVCVSFGNGPGFGTFHGEFSAAYPTFTRTDLACAPWPVATPYATHRIDHPGGDLTVSVQGAPSGVGTLSDPYVLVYDGSFDPSNPCANLLDHDDDSGEGFESLIQGPTDAGQYVLVVTTYWENIFGTYVLTVSH